MKLSIVIPAYNEEAFLGRCLQSVLAEQRCSSAEIEVVVVNNASTDRTGEVARSFPSVRVIDEPRKGLVRARQKGYKVARGELIANVDADSQMPTGWIQTVLREFALDPKLVALSGPYEYYDLSSFTNFTVKLFYFIGKMVGYGNSFLTGRSETMLQGGNFILRRSALEQAGGYDLNFDFYGEDTMIARKMSAFGRVKFTFALTMGTSGRRLRNEGVITMAVRYALNFLWTLLFNRPFTKQYKDIRT